MDQWLDYSAMPISTTGHLLKPLILRWAGGWGIAKSRSQPLVDARSPWYCVWLVVGSYDFICLNHWSPLETLDSSLGRWLDCSTMSVSTNGHLLKPLILRWAVGWGSKIWTSYNLRNSNASATFTKKQYEEPSHRTGTKKALWLTLITFAGLKKNRHSNIAVNVITGEDLFWRAKSYDKLW